MNSGLLAAIGAFLAWGLFPLYWRALDNVPALQIICHRMVWCCLFVTTYLCLRSGLRWARELLRRPRLLLTLTVSASLIACNWFLYIWAINAGHVVETSFGYFINPLVNVLLGVVLLGERLNNAQRLAVAVAALGVGWLTIKAGAPPWIALGLALSFGSYGLIRKLAHVDAVPGLAVEGWILLLPALGILLWSESKGTGGFGHLGTTTDLLLVNSGLITALPLVWFAYGARRIPLSTIGIAQYLAPSLQLVCGVLLLGEPFTRTQAVGFGCIWLALAIYAADGLRRTRHRPGEPAPESAESTVETV